MDNTIVDLVAVTGGLLVALVFVLGILLIIGLKVSRGTRKSSDLSDADEAKLIQDIYHGLAKMEQRVETLETLLLDQQKKGVTK